MIYQACQLRHDDKNEEISKECVAEFVNSPTEFEAKGIETKKKASAVVHAARSLHF